MLSDEWIHKSASYVDECDRTPLQTIAVKALTDLVETRAKLKVMHSLARKWAIHKVLNMNGTGRTGYECKGCVDAEGEHSRWFANKPERHTPNCPASPSFVEEG